MIDLYDLDGNTPIGSITETDLEAWTGALEEESSTDGMDVRGMRRGEQR